MRTLEEQHPDIDFDWPYILDVGAMTPVEVEAPVPLRKRRPRAAESDGADGPGEFAASTAGPASDPELGFTDAPTLSGDLLGELLGRGIAASLRSRHADLAAQIDQSTAPPEAKLGWRHRLSALDPDRWTAPEAVLAGMATVDRDLEALTLEVDRGGRG